MFGTSSLTPPSVYRGSSSSQQYYRLEIPFHVLDEGSQSVEAQETNEESKSSPPLTQPERRSRRPTRRPSCGTGSHR